MATSPDLVEIATRRQVLLERLKTNEAAKFAPFLKEIDAALRDKLTQDELTSYSRTRLEKMLSEVDAILSAIYSRYTAQMDGDFNDIGRHQAEFEAKVLDRITTTDYTAIIPTVDRLQRAIEITPLSVKGADGGSLFVDVVKNWTQSEIDAVNGTIRKGYFQGNTTQQVIQAIRGTKAANYADGLLDTTSRNAEAIVRTGIQHVANAARYSVWQQNDDLVQGYVWISTLDGRTSIICRTLDGRVFAIGKGPVPPAHYRCRSTTAAQLNPEFAHLTAGGKRASMNGQVDGGLNYYSWLKTQSAAFQDEVLGAERAQLFRDGGLSAERFSALQLDRNFSPITLDQMKKLEPLAFERAGLE